MSTMRDAFVPNIPTLSIREFSEVVRKAYLGGKEDGEFLNIACYSKPGIGKSEAMKKVAKSLGINFLNRRLSLVFVTDMQGNPYNRELDDGEIKQCYSSPSYLPSKALQGERGILLLDELNMASNVIAGMIQQLLDSRRIGEYVLPKGWMIVTCMNLRSHGAHVNELSSPNNSRLIHYNVKEDLDVWIEDYASRPESKIHPLIISYLRDNPSHFYVLPKPGEKAYPCPRTWKKASQLLYSGLEDTIDAAIGYAVGSSFKQHFELRHQLPDWKRIIDNDKSYVNSWSYEGLSIPYAATQAGILLSTPKTVQSIAQFINDKFGIEYLQIFIDSILSRLDSNFGVSDRDYALAEKLSCVSIEGSKDACDLFMDIRKTINEVNNSFKA